MIDVDPGPEGVYHCYAKHIPDGGQAPCEGFLSHEQGQDNVFFVMPKGGPDLIPVFWCTNHKARHFLSIDPTCVDTEKTDNEGVLGYIATRPACGALPVTRLVEFHDYDRGDLVKQSEFGAFTKPPDGGGTPYQVEKVMGYVWSSAD
ncbi:MAG: hypothetical protein EXR72_14520 [Myxococcales bacterium]|nr:hypothetical protein [Myxococcales bacterium]